MAKRGKGANARLRIAEETGGYGVQASTGFFEMSFGSDGVSDSQELVADDQLGQGREAAPPSLGVIDVNGQITVGVESRRFGHWLKYLMGHPVSRPVRATGTLTFSAQPAAGSTITLGGTVWTFVASGATGNQTNIGANLAATLTALATNLNASVNANIALSTYTAGATALTIRSKTWAGGNGFTLAADATSNATRSGATLSGGGYVHRFRSGGPRAKGILTFASQPANASTITIGGTVWTFVTAAPAAGQTQIGATLADTLAALAEDLNASADANVVKAAYGCTATTLTVQMRSGGLQSSFAIQGSAGSNSTPTVATALVLPDELPSFTRESALPDAGSYFVSTGGKVGSIAFAWSRSGNVSATIQVIAQGESENAASIAGAPTVLAVQRFSQFQGSVKSGGLPVATLTGAGLTYSNNLEPLGTIRDDGKIEAIDEGSATAQGTLEARFSDDTTYRAAAAANTPIDFTMGWTRSAHESLLIQVPASYLSKPKREISGPGGIAARYEFQGAKTGDWMVEAVLRNDVAGY
jgi:hypothetical protein